MTRGSIPRLPISKWHSFPLHAHNLALPQSSSSPPVPFPQGTLITGVVWKGYPRLGRGRQRCGWGGKGILRTEIWKQLSCSTQKLIEDYKKEWLKLNNYYSFIFFILSYLKESLTHCNILIPFSTQSHPILGTLRHPIWYHRLPW